MNDDKVTLHQLSHDLDSPERRVRHKIRRLVAAGEVIEGEDYLIDPMKFISHQEKLQPRPGSPTNHGAQT